MSKVNYYIDSKQKARHRQRRYETAHKKNTRAKNSDANVYSYYSGYYAEYEKVHYRYKRDVPAHAGKVVAEEIVKPVFKVKRYSRNAKPWRHLAARQFRRKRGFDEDTPSLKGSVYKRYYEIEWLY